MVLESLREVLANTYVLYFKAHSFHWNVEGPYFPQYHEFLGNYYHDLFGAVDVLAELVRTLDSYAPVSLSRMIDLSSITESTAIPSALDMMKALKTDNDFLLATLMIAYKAAEDGGELGISNYLQDRIQAHQKHAWMLKAITK